MVNCSDTLQSQSFKMENYVLQHTAQWVLEFDFECHLFAHYTSTNRLKKDLQKNNQVLGREF